MTITENKAAKSDGSAEVVPFGELRITDKNKGEIEEEGRCAMTDGGDNQNRKTKGRAGAKALPRAEKRASVGHSWLCCLRLLPKRLHHSAAASPSRCASPEPAGTRCELRGEHEASSIERDDERCSSFLRSHHVD